MIQEDQKILFISNAKVIAIIKLEDSLETGFTQKKIVVTTRRCLMFQSLTNQARQMEYQVIKKKMVPAKGQPLKTPKRSHLSINQYPQCWFNADQRDAKVVIDLEPSIISFINKLGIKNLVKNTTGMVLLKNHKKQKFQVMVFPTLKDSFRFAKGLMCAKAWLLYEKHSFQTKQALNFLWVRILQQIVTHENSLTLIDPDLFQNGSYEELKSFFVLVSGIPFAHSFQLRYSIVNQESVNYTIDFLKTFEDKLHSLNLGKTGLQSENLLRILTSNLKTKNLMKLNLQDNKLTDRCFQGLQFLARQNKKLSYINLSRNQITLSNFSNFLQFLKSTPVILNLDLSYNKIHDGAISNIQKFILFALNPPIQQMDLSFNDFTLKGSWRLYLGFLKNFRIHVYLNFIIYPLPFKKEIFAEVEVDFPRRQQEINFNMHSALIQEFEQQSIMKHTMTDILVPPQTLTIKFVRQLLSNVRLPKNKLQMSKTLQLSNDIQNFIYSSQAVQRVYDLAVKMKSFPFEIPPRTRVNFVFYLNKKLNEALLIRDHYSVKYILKSMKQLDIPYQGYLQRLQRVQLRDKIFCKRLQRVLQFRCNEVGINKEIDQLVKQGLRLYLQGRGIELLYYLKYSRDQYVQRLLAERYNPQHEIYTKMAARNLSNDDKVSSKEFYIPYEIKIQKRINENFYLHPWQTNYLILSEMTSKSLNECLQFLEQSEKKETFAKYFERIQQRVEFIKNEFALFTYKQFKVSYTDLKVNACRLLFLYKNIQDTHFYLQIPIYIKKRPISCEKSVTVHNPLQFVKKYHIVNYPNISYAAKMNHFYNYTGIITRYQSQTFQNQANKTLKLLNTSILKVMENYIHGKKSKQEMFDKIILPIRGLIDIVRRSIYPQEIKQQIFLHLIGWRKGRYGRNEEVMELIPWLTMYLKPPLQLEKYLVAAMLQCKREQLPQYPMCLVSDPNKPTSDDILKMDAQFVQRDWLPPDNILKTQIMNFGKVNIQIHMLDKRKIVFKIAQSMNVSQLMNHLMGYHELSCQDRQSFWLYKLDRETQQTTPLTGSEYVGQIMTFLLQTQVIICRRRVYSRQIKYTFSLYGQNMIDSLYSQIKFDYMMRALYDTQKNIFEITALYFIIDNSQNFDIIQKKNPKLKQESVDQYILQQLNKIQLNYPAYIPKHILARIMKDKQTIFAQIRAKVSEKMLKKQHTAIYDMKTKFIKLFQSFPQFCSTNYKMQDNNSIELRVFINCMYIYVESQNMREYIKLQKIISIIPKTRYLLISYHKNQNIVGQIPLFSQETNILAVSMDLLSYCLMRLKMASNNLYEINKYQRIQWQIEQYQKSLKKIYNKSVQQKLFKNRQDKQNIYSKIMKMSITLMDLKQLIYYNESNYIKSYLDRKLYANKTEKKMAYNEAMDQQQARDTQNWHYNVFKNIFPQYQDKYMKNNNDSQQFYRQKSIRPNRNGEEFNQDNLNNDQYNQNSEYDVEFYNENNQPISVNSNTNKENINEKPKEEETYSPFKPTEKKVDPRQAVNNNINPDDQYVSTSKKQPPKIRQPQVQPFMTQPANQNQPIEDQQPVFSNKKAGGRAPPRRRQR